MFILRKIIKIVFLAFITWLIVRTFFFQTYRIPSASMHGTLFEGDYVIVNKLAYGPRIPITPLAITLAGQKKHISWQLPYVRLFGYGRIQRNDVIAFNYDLGNDLPIDLREEYIKRCVALPGDTLRISNSKVYVNGLLTEPATIYKNYTVLSDEPIDTLLLQRLMIFKNSFTEDQRTYHFFMSAAQADALYKLSYIKSVTIKPFAKDEYSTSVYPNYPAIKWNYDFFGPLYIPKKGDSIVLDKTNLILYQRLIERFEKTPISVRNDTAFINNKRATHYVFKNNYYFVMGDNRYNSVDSRSWGFIPESHIIGKACILLRKGASWREFFSTIK